MKTKLVITIVTMFLFLSTMIKGQSNTNFFGKWKFQAPDAPEEAASGNIIIKPDSAIILLSTGEKYSSDWVRENGDSLVFESQMQDGVVRVSLKINDNSNMTGIANWGIGETPILLKKEE